MSWRKEYALLILLSTLVDFFAAKKIDGSQNKAHKKYILIFSLIFNLGILFIFKYLLFFTENVNLVLESFGLQTDIPPLNLLLPVGISFYTFQTMSYTIDVYKGKIKPEKHLGYFALYVTYFPQLVAGPIERASNLLSEFRKNISLDPDRMKYGLILIGWGLFKKVVIADRLAEFINPIFNSPHNSTGLESLVASYFFTFQIYCDFSGYSDIAIGSSALLGISLMKNFQRPYLATSFSSFWSRWHISLSTWFRDYVYIPLGGNRVSQSRLVLNILIVFLISGIWHGANWTFVLWGLTHGVLLVLESLLLKNIGEIKLNSYLKLAWRVIFFHLIVFTWIMFRANNIHDFIIIVKNIINISPSALFFEIKQYILSHGRNFPLARLGPEKFLEFNISVIAIAFLVISQILKEKNLISWNKFVSLPLPARWAHYIVLIVLLVLLGTYSSDQEFIYFQF